MSALPGSPAIQNAIPMPFLGTTAFAAPGLGIVTGLVMLLLGLAWLNRRAARARTAGEGYGAHADGVPGTDVATREHAQGAGFDIAELSGTRHRRERAGTGVAPFALAVLPVVVVIVTNFAFIQVVIPMLDTSWLAEPLFRSTTIESVRGVWAVIVALFLAILLLVAGNWRRLTDLRASLTRAPTPRSCRSSIPRASSASVR